MSIEKLVRAYNDFQNEYGQSVQKDFKPVIENLFAPEFKKIANGTELVSKRSELESQLAGVMNFAGKWVVAAYVIIPSDDNKRCTIRYILSSDKGGNFDVIAILSSVDGEKIDSIDEIYYQMK